MMNHEETILPFCVIHSVIVNEYERWEHLYTGKHIFETVRLIQEEGSVEDVLCYDPKDALQDFQESILCISRYEDEFVYLEEVYTKEQLIEIMQVFFDDAADAFESDETLQQFILDYNETAAFADSGSAEKFENLMNQYMNSAAILYRCDLPFDEIEKAEYALHKMEMGEIPEYQYDYLRRYMEVFAVSRTFIACVIVCSPVMSHLFKTCQEQIEKQLNESFCRYFPEEYHYRRVLLAF